MSFKKILFASVFLVLLGTGVAHADPVYWTATIDGVIATRSGTLGINLDGEPTSPNPTDTIWTDCPNNWVFFHKSVDGSANGDEQNRAMLQVALAAYLGNKPLRLALERATDGTCYSSQMFIVQ